MAGAASDPEGKEGVAAVDCSDVVARRLARHDLRQIVEAMYPMATSFGSQIDKEMTSFRVHAHRQPGQILRLDQSDAA